MSRKVQVSSRRNMTTEAVQVFLVLDGFYGLGRLLKKAISGT